MWKNFWAVFFLAALFFWIPLTGRADYNSWQDPAYDFTKVKTIYLAPLDFSGALDQSETYRLNMDTYYRKKAAEIKKDTLLLAPEEVPRALLPGETAVNVTAAENNSAPKQPAQAVQIPAEAVQKRADIYLTAALTILNGDSYLVPAHTEWRSKEIEEGYYDKDGHYHSYYRTVSYPEYVPDQYVPYVTVGMKFNAYDVKTGKLVFTSEDLRRRDSESQPMNVYKRIIDRFYKNLKTVLKK